MVLLACLTQTTVRNVYIVDANIGEYLYDNGNKQERRLSLVKL